MQAITDPDTGYLSSDIVCHVPNLTVKVDSRELCRAQTRTRVNGTEYFGYYPTHYHFEKVMEAVVYQLGESTPVVMSPIRVRTVNHEFERFTGEKLLKTNEEIKQFCEDSPTGNRCMKLKQFLQKGVDKQLVRFITEIYPQHPTTWHTRILCGIFLPKGDVHGVSSMLVQASHDGESIVEMAQKVVALTGVDIRKAEELTQNWITIQGIALQEMGLTGKTEPFKPNSPINIMALSDALFGK